MFSSDDTIVAIATPPGRGGIGVVRLSGACARDLASQVVTRREPLAPREATLTKVCVRDAGTARGSDHAIVTWFPAPHSYTGEHVVEISTHGSPVVLREIVGALVAAGARLARPGEFTLRAFLNARIDLAHAGVVQAGHRGEARRGVGPVEGVDAHARVPERQRQRDGGGDEGRGAAGSAGP